MRQVYLDYAATTPCHNKVIEVVEKYMKTEFANPSSQHVMGKKHSMRCIKRKVRLQFLLVLIKKK